MELKDVGKRYDKEWVIRNLNWTLQPGEIVSIIGLNGAGKTTLLYLLSGLFAPSEGEVTVDGERLTRETLAARKTIFFMPDFPLAPSNWTLSKLLTSLIILYEREDVTPNKGAFRDMVDELDLGKVVSKPLAQMSRGQVYKSFMLCARVLAPRFWILDEPFASGVDAHGLAVLKKWFNESANAENHVIFTTQLPDIASAYAHRLLLIHATQSSFFNVRGGKIISANGAALNMDDHLESLRCSK